MWQRESIRNALSNVRLQLRCARYGADDAGATLSPGTCEDATVPGVGPVVALTYRATVDVLARFRNSKAAGAMFGLTPSKYQSGEINRTGAISKCADDMLVRLAK